jgi:uncharacterized protein YbcV (DUF1398 family)
LGIVSLGYEEFKWEVIKMTAPLTEGEFQEIIRRRNEGVISFSEFLDVLSQRGINDYVIDVATGQATYKGKDSTFKPDTQVHLIVTGSFNKDK